MASAVAILERSRVPSKFGADGEHLRWSPDATRLAISDGNRIAIWESDRAGVAASFKPPRARDDVWTWAPDSVHLLFWNQSGVLAVGPNSKRLSRVLELPFVPRDAALRSSRVALVGSPPDVDSGSAH